MRAPPRDRARFVISGLGAVSAYGWGVDALWNGLLSGRTAIGTLGCFAGEGHRTDVSAEVGDPPAGLAERYPGWDELSRAERFALVAVDEAVGQAGGPDGGRAALIGDAPELVGVFFGGSTAGMVESEEVFRPSGEISEGDRLRAHELRMLASQPLDVPAATVARHLGAAGTVVTVSSACASGTQALGVALDALRAGEVEVAVVGGADSLCRLTYAGFNSLRVVDERACRPFRAGRAGMTLGEGAGVVVIEPEERALDRIGARGGRIFASLLGVGNSCDAHHMTAPHPEGLGAALAVERALRDAGLPADVSTLAFLNAHGTGTPLNDLSEWRGVASVFGSDASRVPLTATKASVGHLLGSSGAIEAVVTALSLDRATVPPTPWAEEPGETVDPETPGRLVLGEALRIDFPDGGAEENRGSVALSTSFGFGGANAAAAFGRVVPRPASRHGADP
jgi:3-oxoacyl-[acyl-carrier-protein] synthase II